MKDETALYLVDDDPEIRLLLANLFKREGFQVRVAANARELDSLLSEHGEPDLVILDCMMPGEDGLSVCRRLRGQSSISSMGIIMLTARGEDIDRIIGLEVGADDYLPKPFNPRELIARVRAVLRRREHRPAAGRRRICGPFTIDLDQRSVTGPSGAMLELTTAEYDLLACFIERPNRVLTRDQLLDWTRGREAAPFDRTIDVQMSRLRKKLETAGAAECIKTIRNVGYILAETVEDEKP
jgi:two-component system OmpR family response regulator